MGAFHDPDPSIRKMAVEYLRVFYVKNRAARPVRFRQYLLSGICSGLLCMIIYLLYAQYFRVVPPDYPLVLLYGIVSISTLGMGFEMSKHYGVALTALCSVFFGFVAGIMSTRVFMLWYPWIHSRIYIVMIGSVMAISMFHFLGKQLLQKRSSMVRVITTSGLSMLVGIVLPLLLGFTFSGKNGIYCLLNALGLTIISEGYFNTETGHIDI